MLAELPTWTPVAASWLTVDVTPNWPFCRHGKPVQLPKWRHAGARPKIL